MKLSIAGMDKRAVLAALYNSAKPLGMGMRHYTPGPLTSEELDELFKDEDLYFDYVKGRVMKVDLTADSFDPRLYDRDNGQGAAELALIDAGLYG